MSSKRTQLLADLREIRNGIEMSYDKCRDLGLFALPLAQQAQEKLREALILLKQEVDHGEHHTVSSWPPTPFSSSSSPPASVIVQTQHKS